MEYTLRKTTAGDSAFCYNVKKTVLYDYVTAIWGWDEKVQEDFHEANFHPEIIAVIEVAGESIGTVEVLESEEKIFISSLYLLPRWQGKGIGTAIMKKYMTIAEDKSKRIELEVLKLNKRAQRLYASLGFTLTEKDNEKYLMYKE